MPGAGSAKPIRGAAPGKFTQTNSAYEGNEQPTGIKSD
jgi:hypothetical protein